MLKVQRKQCETCIYRKDSILDIVKLEAQCADARLSGHFSSYRACHHAQSGDVVCFGFWARHKDNFDAGQLAQRLKVVEMVDVDDL